MSEKDYTIDLSPDGKNRYRHYHRTIGGQVVEFRIQYEARIEGKWRAVVRYDSAHGYAHTDLLHPDGSQTKTPFWGRTPGEVLTYGERDIKRNWQIYRAKYERGMRNDL